MSEFCSLSAVTVSSSSAAIKTNGS